MITAIIEKFQRRKQKNILENHPLVFLKKTLKLGINNHFIIYKNIHEFPIGENVSFRDYNHMTVQDKAKLTIESNVFFNNHCSITCLESISIGENTLFGENVKLYVHNHSYERNDKGLQIFHSEFNTAPISIGKNCWLGSNVVVLKGVTIGNNCIIGTGVLVYKDVPSNSIIKAKQELITHQI